MEDTKKNTKETKPKVEKKKEETLVDKYQREKLENCLKRRFFVINSYEIYGGVAGFYDFGPPGCALKNNIEAAWREHFILEENMLEINSPNLTPESVLKASGHVEKFSDFSVKCKKTGACYRADKLIQEHIDKHMAKKKNLKPEEISRLNILKDQVEKMNAEQLDKVIEAEKVKAPDSGADLHPATPFNLMFGTSIGPSGGVQGYLRPETAQGHFVNFRKLIEFNGGRIPFASAMIGLGFRNEISPRAGLLRVREFTMAEIEHYVDPLNKSHKKFHLVKDLTIPLWTKDAQGCQGPIIQDMTMGQAVEKGIINNESIAYFMARTYLFFVKVGIKHSGIRFRQHCDDEMAHYATDCWDAEVETSYGWIEVVGHADRTCFDLDRHSKASGVELCASRKLKVPKVIKSIKATLNKQSLFKTLGKDIGTAVQKVVDKFTDEDKEKYLIEFTEHKKITLNLEKGPQELSKDLLTVLPHEEIIHEEKYTPGVIEPAFGIGRIVYCVMEHCFRVREIDDKRTFFAFPPLVAPVKVSILPLVDDDKMKAFIEPLRATFVANGISYKIDETADNIGKRYARTDELGISYATTIDTQTLEDDTVTLRELNSMKQIRLHYKDVAPVMKDVINLQTTWDDMIKKYQTFDSK